MHIKVHALGLKRRNVRRQNIHDTASLKLDVQAKHEKASQHFEPSSLSFEIFRWGVKQEITIIDSDISSVKIPHVNKGAGFPS